MKRFASILIIIVLMFGLVGCGGNETPQKVDKTEQTSTETQQEETESKEAAKEEEPSQEIFNIGDSIQIGDVIVTVNSVREDAGGDFIKPNEGNTYYILDLTIENNGKEAFASSTLIQMSLHDGEGYKYDIAIGPETKGSVDGEVGAGRKLRGEVAFEIPKESTNLEFVYDYDLLGTGQIIVKLDR